MLRYTADEGRRTAFEIVGSESVMVVACVRHGQVSRLCWDEVV
jgi:hypothetical protein